MYQENKGIGIFVQNDTADYKSLTWKSWKNKAKVNENINYKA